MDRKTADLGSYITDSHYGGSTSFNNDRVFDQGITHLQPLLESDRTNRILLYPGSFNPPHRGHEALLHHAFTSSQDINIIAAIILPLDDDSVEAKCRALSEGLVLTKDQRVRLWRGYVPHDWYWVYDRSTTEWHSFRRRLTDAIIRDGFDLKFVVLSGPDYVRRNSLPPWKAWDCEEIIVSDAGRSADFTTQEGTLWQLKGCESWKHVLWNDEELNRHTTRMAAFLGGGMSLLAPTRLREILEKEPKYFELLVEELRSEVASKIETVRVCCREDAPEQTIRFIPAEGDMVHISSTHVRQILKTCAHEKLRENLDPIALNPEILVEFCSKKIRHSPKLS